MSKGNSLVSFTINRCLSLPHDVLSQLRKNIWSINMCLLVSLLTKSKAKKKKNHKFLSTQFVIHLPQSEAIKD